MLTATINTDGKGTLIFYPSPVESKSLDQSHKNWHDWKFDEQTLQWEFQG